MRLTKLEDAITKLAQIRKTADISAEEMKTYLKIRAVLEPDFCGPNDCMRLCIPVGCYRCHRCLICYRCINECICGPCGGGAGGGIGGGFAELGG
jgi:hypothetical protein